MALSVKQQLAGETVLITGGLGFLGSVVVEQLLRLTDVKRVYLLVRGKKNVPASQRVEQLLCSSLFNMLHKEAAGGSRNVFAKVAAVDGDLSFPGLGLSPEDARMLRDEVGVIIHCAAHLELDAEIQKTLKANYCGTRELLHLASEMPALRSFVFTSTYFVNNFLPRNSVVKEQVHTLPLSLDGKALNHDQLVQTLLALEPQEADRQAAQLMASLNFASTYAFGKHLTEQLVNEACIRLGVSKVIVRPSLISGLAGDPYPGFITGYAGSPGYIMGYAVGFFHNIGSVAFASDYILDLIPCDTVAALVIAAAASAAAASGPAAPTTAKVYHAASAHCHPLPITYAMMHMNKFWAANPPPLVLPCTWHVTYNGKHIPTEWSLQLGRWITDAKIWLVGKVLTWAGKAREARALRNGFKAFCVQNSFSYSRSIVSAVDNARELRAQISEGEQRDWQVVWDDGVMAWDPYGYTFFAGVRRLLFRVCGDVKTDVPHLFEYKQAADTSVQKLVINSSSTSSSRAGSSAGSSCSSDAGDVCAVVTDPEDVPPAAAGKAAARQLVQLSVTAGSEVMELVQC